MQSILNHYPQELINKAKAIKAIICDVDGVLTDGGIIYDNSGNEFKKFNVKDGHVIKHLRNSGILIGAITGRKSEVVKLRCTELNMDFDYHGVKNKLEIYREIKKQFGLDDNQIAYVGDDIIDLSALSICGLSIAPADAVSYVKSKVDLTTHTRGGEGVLREAADFILASQGLLEEIIENYMSARHS